jgi:hypothetical protein
MPLLPRDEETGRETNGRLNKVHCLRSHCICWICYSKDVDCFQLFQHLVHPSVSCRSSLLHDGRSPLRTPRLGDEIWRPVTPFFILDCHSLSCVDNHKLLVLGNYKANFFSHKTPVLLQAPFRGKHVNLVNLEGTESNAEDRK